MGLFDEIKKLARPRDDYDDFDGFTGREDEAVRPMDHARPADNIPRASREQEPRESRPAREPRASREPRAGYGQVAAREQRDQNRVMNIHATAQLQVVLVKPERFENAAEVADHLRDKRTVVLNLEQTHKDIARRLIDFLSGVAYAQDGKIKKVAASTYIITPYNVGLLGDLIDELENNGLYF